MDKDTFIRKLPYTVKMIGKYKVYNTNAHTKR